MYAGDSRGTSSGNPDVVVAGPSQQGDALPEAGQALEVIELANGETIWYVVEKAPTNSCAWQLTTSIINQVHCERAAR